ncbi:MAG: carotenoid biosynthesis protein [Ilumatobacteraceae bacterium]
MTAHMQRARWTAAGLTLAGMVATPLATHGGAVRRTLANAVVGGAALTTALNAARRWGVPRAVGAASIVGIATTAVERIGTVTGLPFGRYRYTGRLRPEVVGVPVSVPRAWWAMAVPLRDAAHAALGKRSTPLGRVGLGAVALSAWDLFLDPQMTAEGYWRWERRGIYRGIPLTNYVGWLLTSAAVMATLERLLPTQEPDAALVAEYAAMGVMETVGFAAFFRDRVVAVVGAVGMLPLAALATWRTVRRG